MIIRTSQSDEAIECWPEVGLVVGDRGSAVYRWFRVPEYSASELRIKAMEEVTAGASSSMLIAPTFEVLYDIERVDNPTSIEAAVNLYGLPPG